MNKEAVMQIGIDINSNLLTLEYHGDHNKTRIEERQYYKTVEPTFK